MAQLHHKLLVPFQKPLPSLAWAQGLSQTILSYIKECEKGLFLSDLGVLYDWPWGQVHLMECCTGGYKSNHHDAIHEPTVRLLWRMKLDRIHCLNHCVKFHGIHSGAGAERIATERIATLSSRRGTLTIVLLSLGFCDWKNGQGAGCSERCRAVDHYDSEDVGLPPLPSARIGQSKASINK